MVTGFSIVVSSSDNLPLATAVKFPLACECACVQYIIRFEEKFGSTAISNNPPCPEFTTFGIPVIVFSNTPKVENIFNLPCFSVTNNLPSGRYVIPQGDCKFVEITSTSYGVVVVILPTRVCPSKAGE